NFGSFFLHSHRYRRRVLFQTPHSGWIGYSACWLRFFGTTDASQFFSFGRDFLGLFFCFSSFFLFYFLHFHPPLPPPPILLLHLPSSRTTENPVEAQWQKWVARQVGQGS
ncbi:hypothetical protein M406DRAFT_102731, partial [Cryphonectria parasitica EP155]